MQMFIVSDQKLNQVREAIAGWSRGVIVLRGPSGSGKRTALDKACGELGLRLITGAPERQLVSFCTRMEAQSREAITGITAVVFSEDSDQLAAVVEAMEVFPHVLVVFSLSENDLSYKRVRGVFAISFSAFSDTAIRKLVASCVVSDIDSTTIEEIVEIAAGDARQAQLQIDLRNLRRSGQSAPDVKVKRKRKANDSVRASAGRDNAFSLFHTLGKVLYNKEGRSTDCEALARQPVVADSGEIPLLILHENLPDFVGDMSSQLQISSSLSFTDIYMRKSVKEDMMNWFVFKAFTSLNSETSERSVRGFAAFRRPRLRDAYRLRTHHAADLSRLRSKFHWADYRTLFVLDAMMTMTAGAFPPDLSWAYKRRIYNFVRGIEEATSVDPEDVIEAKELEDDPLEEC